MPSSGLPRLGLEQLRVFHALATGGSVAEAARLLFVTQPAVSYGIRRLEERLGLRLFRRSGRRLALTAEGRILLETTSAMFERLEEGERRLEACRLLQSGTVRFAIPELLMHRLMRPALRAFHAAHPGVGIDVRVENRLSELLAEVRRGAVEFMLVTLPEGVPAGEEFDCAPLGRFYYAFAASRAFFPALEGRALSLREAAALPLITLDRGHVARDILSGAFAREGLGFHPAFECAAMSLIEDFTRAGLGVGFSIGGCVRSLPPDPDLFEVRLRKPLARGSLVLVRKKGSELSPASRAFLEVLSELRGGESGTN